MGSAALWAAVDDHQSENITAYAVDIAYQEAMASDEASEWSAACAAKMGSLREMGVYETVELPPGRKAIKSKWVFDQKQN